MSQEIFNASKNKIPKHTMPKAQVLVFLGKHETQSVLPSVIVDCTSAVWAQVLSYIGYMHMRCWKGYGFQAI